jgi:hypothetical protein
MEPADKPLATVKPVVVPEIVTLPCEVDVCDARRLGRELNGAFGPRATVVIAEMSLTESAIPPAYGTCCWPMTLP